MDFLDSLERKYGRWAIPNLTLYLIFFQSLFFVFAQVRPDFVLNCLLIPERVIHGEPWRLVSFIFLPPSASIIWLVMALYFFYFVGTALEASWGAFRYNLYLLTGWLATVAASFVYPAGIGTNAFIGLSVFLAFAYLYPEFQILLFFVLPIRVKWLALIAWIGIGLAVIFARDGMTRMLAVVPVANFLLFFGRSLLLRLRTGGRQVARKAKRLSEGDQPFHTCALCGVTDKSNPKMEFRYCPDCAGTPCYCIDHIHNHEHRRTPAMQMPPA